MPEFYQGQSIAPEVRGVTAPAATPATPVATQVGDLILAFGFVPSGAFSDDAASGWTYLYDYEGSGVEDSIHVVYKIATAAGAVAQTPFETIDRAGLLVIKSGTYDPDFFDRGPFDTAQVVSSAAPNPGAVITPVENCLVIAAAAWRLAAPATVAVTPPTAYTEAFEVAGSHSYELSVAYKAVSLASSENPAAFADDVAPNATRVLTFPIRPYGWRTAIPVPLRGEEADEEVLGDAWKASAERERYLYQRMPRLATYRASGSPLYNASSISGYGISMNSEDLGNCAEIESCVVGDKFLIDVQLLVELTGTWPGDALGDPWYVKLRVIEDVDGTPVENDVEGARWLIPQGDIWDPARIDKKFPVRLRGVWEVATRGTCQVAIETQIIDDGNGDNAVNIYDLAFRVMRFPVALQPNVPSLTSLDFDLADRLGGDEITITGVSMGGATSCTVGGTSATITENTGTTLKFIMPAKAAGTYNVAVTTGYGTSNTLSIEAWDPGVEASVVAFAESPDYSSPSTGNGTWTMRVGTSWSHATSAPPATGDPPGAPPYTTGAPYWSGSLSAEYLSGPALNTLFDLAGASSGSFGAVWQNTGTQAYGAGLDNLPAIFSDGAGASQYGLVTSNDSGTGTVLRYSAFIDTNAGRKSVNHDRLTVTAGDRDCVLMRFQDGAGSTGTLEVQVNGTKSDGTSGFESVSGFSTLTSCSDAGVLGTNAARTAAQQLGFLYAFFFATSKVSDTFAGKFKKWSRVRHRSRA